MARGTQSTAFVRQRKLPLPCLVGALLSQRSQFQQLMLDSFFASLAGNPGLEGVASDCAFAQARNKLKPAALTALNAQLLDLAQARGWMPLWHGLRVVAADASMFMPATRAFHQTRLAAQPDQRLIGLYLPGTELCLHAHLYGAETGERLVLFENMQHLQDNDVLVLDRGYPAAWFIAVTFHHIVSISFSAYPSQCVFGTYRPADFRHTGASEGPSADISNPANCRYLLNLLCSGVIDRPQKDRDA